MTKGAVMSELELPEVEYHGRKASRGGSERRRINILDAALRVAVREGVRAVRHRAVATEAKVPLSATTYYFKDITDLLVDTFTMFYERATVMVKRNLVDSVAQPLKQDLKKAWKEILVEALAVYLAAQIKERRDHLIAEQAFFVEAHHYPQLMPLALKYQQAFCSKFAQLAAGIPVKNIELLTWIVYTLQRQLSYEALLQPKTVKAAWFEERLRPVISALSV